MRRRYPLYWSDIKDGLHLQGVASIIFLYFACITPIVTFGGLMGDGTDNYMVRNAWIILDNPSHYPLTDQVGYRHLSDLYHIYRGPWRRSWLVRYVDWFIPCLQDNLSPLLAPRGPCWCSRHSSTPFLCKLENIWFQN